MNKTRFLAFAWIFFLFLIQNGIQFSAVGKLPPLILIGIIFYALLEGPFFGLVIGCFGGLLMDLFGTGKLGFDMFLFGLLGLLAGLAASNLFRESLWTQLLLPALGNYAVNLIHLVLAKINAQEAVRAAESLQEAFVWRELLILAVLSPALFWVLKKVSWIREERSSIWRAG